jgi:hypothetical protein
MPTHVYTMNGPAVDLGGDGAAVIPAPGPNKLTYEYAVQTGDYLPYLEAYNGFYNNWLFPQMAKQLENKNVPESLRRLLAGEFAFWLDRMWQNKEFAQSMAVGINNQMYANARTARGMWSTTDQQATAAAYPDFMKFILLYSNYIDRMRTILATAGVLSYAEAAEALKAFIFLANHKHGNYPEIKARFNGSAAIGEPVTITILAVATIVAKILAAAGGIAASVAAIKNTLTGAGIPVDQLVQKAADAFKKRAQPTPPPATGPTPPPQNNQVPKWALPAAAVLAAFFLFK